MSQHEAKEKDMPKSTVKMTADGFAVTAEYDDDVTIDPDDLGDDD